MPDNRIVENNTKISVLKRPSKDSVKKIIAVFGVIFVLFIIPATVSIALQPVNLNNKAATGTSDVVTTAAQSNVFLDVFMKIYPYVLGILIIVWGGLIFYYLGMRSRKKIS